MKVYISCDLEGISGLNKVDYMYPENMSMEKRNLVTQDVNAAIQGAIEAGATEIYVNDTHPPERTILVEELNPVAQLIPNGIPFFTLQDIDTTFDALLLIGLHSKPGTYAGFLDHVWNPKAITDIRVNGISVGEIGLNSIAAGFFQVPVVLVTGDRAACVEANQLLGRIETVVTKENISRYQARTYPPALIRKEIQEKTRKALQNLADFHPFNITLPLTYEVDFVHTGFTEMALNIPGCKMTGPRSISLELENGEQLHKIQLLVIATTLFVQSMDKMY